MANTYTGSDVGKAGLNVKKTDNSVDVNGVSEIQLASNLSLFDNGGGSVTVDSSGGGGGSGTVTSVALSGGTTGLTVTGSPITTSGTIILAGNLTVANGGTGQTTYTNGQLLIGNTTGNTLSKANLTAGTGISIANGAGSITITAQNNGTVTSVDTGSNLTGGSITGAGTIELLYDAITPVGPSPGDPVAPPGHGFFQPPPDDQGYVAYGWARVQTNDPAAATAYIPIWIDA